MELDSKLDEKIISLIARAVPRKFKKVRLTRETQLQKELGFDSLGIVALVFRFEEAFSVDISQLDLKINIAKIRTVNDLIDISREVLSKIQVLSQA
jgi:acyl carrier protein